MRRPDEIAADDTPSILPVLHVLDSLSGYDYAVLLQATSPLREVQDIDGAIELCLSRQAESCVSVCLAEASPYWMYALSDGALQPLLPLPKGVGYQRQKLPPAYQLNGAVYVDAVTFLRERRAFIGPDTLGYVMPTERSGDIDSLLDFEYLEFRKRKELG